jgi:hypothetical protein
LYLARSGNTSASTHSWNSASRSRSQRRSAQFGMSSILIPRLWVRTIIAKVIALRMMGQFLCSLIGLCLWFPDQSPLTGMMRTPKMGSLAKLMSFSLGTKTNIPAHRHTFMHLILGVLLHILGLPHHHKILPLCRLPRRRKKMKMKFSRCALGMLNPGPCYLLDHPPIPPRRPPLPRGPDHPKLAPHRIRIT